MCALKSVALSSYSILSYSSKPILYSPDGEAGVPIPTAVPAGGERGGGAGGVAAGAGDSGRQRRGRQGPPRAGARTDARQHRQEGE